jgi:hypothetical protein
MTAFKSTDGIVIGQPMSPFFGAQNGIQGAGGPMISQPTTAPVAGGMQATGVQMSTLEQMSRGLIPLNALVNTVNGVSVGGAVNVIGSDPSTVAQTFSNGNGQETCRGVSVGPNGAVNQQIMVDGYSYPAQLSTGATAKNTSSLVEAPAAASTTTANVALIANQFGG